jgi:hypothetical protein
MVFRKFFYTISLSVYLFAQYAFADTVTIDWTKVVKHVDPLSFGMDAAASITGTDYENAGYISAMKYINGTSKGNTALIRLHQWGMLNTWTTNGWWDAAKVLRCVRALKNNGFTIVINIPDGPKGQFSTLDTNKIGQFCVDLVRIVNVDGKCNVKYWEVGNERDQIAFGPSMLDPAGLADMVRRCRAAMKKVDSTIIVGGPAFGDAPDINFMLKFARSVAPDIDFISFHAYAVGNKQNASDAELYNSTRTKMGDIVKTLRDTLSVLSPNHYIALHCNEYSITWDWNYVDPRIHTNKMAVYVALVMTQIVANGGDVSNIWNDKETAFGMMSGSNEVYLPGKLFHLFNTYLMGDMVASAITDQNSVVAFAVLDSATRSLALINRSSSKQDVALVLKGAPADMVMKRHQIWTDGYPEPTTITVADLTKGISLPDNSVTVLTGSGSLLSGVRPVKFPVDGAVLRSKNGPIRLSVYTMTGRLVGTHSTTTDQIASVSLSKILRSGFAKAVPSGIYVVAYSGGSSRFTRRCIQEFR